MDTPESQFLRAVEALRCAINLQTAVAARGAGAGGACITLRIGIALGDVVIAGGDLFGDGVNVAARLEALADPGGILVSAAVAEQAGGRVDCVLEDIGPLTLKNIPRPVSAFRISIAATPVTHSTVTSPGPPSLVVLPFANLSGDAAEDYFADGFT